MRICSVSVKNFRSLRDVSLEIDRGLTVIAGENDAGKSSLLECLRVFTEGRGIEPSDFSYGANAVEIRLATDTFLFEKHYSLSDGSVSDRGTRAKPTPDYLERLNNWMEDPETDLSNPEENEALKKCCRVFGIQVRSNSNTQTLKSRLADEIDKSRDSEYWIENARFPDMQNIQLDGKHFENIPAFFKEVYLKDKQRSLWDAPLQSGQSLRELVDYQLEEYTKEIREQLVESRTTEKIKTFLPSLTEIHVEPAFIPSDFNFSANVKFLEGAEEIDINKKGDGTKRRVTMALLEMKRESGDDQEADAATYILDEPDTHLHVKAQMHLVETLDSFASEGHQVILTTHSPFILNSVRPDQLRIISDRGGNNSAVSQIDWISATQSQALQNLGLENTYLFFGRTVILVEGQTEERFLRSSLIRRTQKPPESSLIKILDVGGVSNIPGFSRAMLEFHDSSRMYVLHDNDLSEELEELIRRLAIPEENRFVVGEKEFEDAFHGSVLEAAWNADLADKGKQAPETWRAESIEELRTACRGDPSRKFSKELRELSAGSNQKMSKPILGEALGKHGCNEHIPDQISALLRKVVA